jgi:hypothetical protein
MRRKRLRVAGWVSPRAVRAHGGPGSGRLGDPARAVREGGRGPRDRCVGLLLHGRRRVPGRLDPRPPRAGPGDNPDLADDRRGSTAPAGRRSGRAGRRGMGQLVAWRRGMDRAGLPRRPPHRGRPPAVRVQLRGVRSAGVGPADPVRRAAGGPRRPGLPSVAAANGRPLPAMRVRPAGQSRHLPRVRAAGRRGHRDVNKRRPVRADPALRAAAKRGAERGVPVGRRLWHGRWRRCRASGRCPAPATLRAGDVAGGP